MHVYLSGAGDDGAVESVDSLSVRAVTAAAGALEKCVFFLKNKNIWRFPRLAFCFTHVADLHA